MRSTRWAEERCGSCRSSSTIDPERDTPAKLKPYVAAFGPRFVGLTGDLKTITKVADLYRVYIKKQPLENGNYAMDHSSVIYLMGPDGKFVGYWDDTSVGPTSWPPRSRKLI